MNEIQQQNTRIPRTVRNETIKWLKLIRLTYFPPPLTPWTQEIFERISLLGVSTDLPLVFGKSRVNKPGLNDSECKFFTNFS